ARVFQLSLLLTFLFNAKAQRCGGANKKNICDFKPSRLCVGKSHFAAVANSLRSAGVADLGAAACFARRSSSALPLATNSSLNFATKLCTGHEQASPNAQIVRPPGILSAIFTK